MYELKSDNNNHSSSESSVKCLACGKYFIPNGKNKSRQHFCNFTHYNVCPVCGKTYEIPKGKLEYSEKDKSIKFPKACSKECSNKLRSLNLKKSMKEKYGHENPSQCEEFSEKRSQSLKRVSKESRKKREATMTRRYGVKYAMQSEELKSKIRQTNIERYGTWNPAKNDEVRVKISERLKDPEVQARYLETALENWGVKRPSMLPEVQSKMKETCIERYGTPWASQSEHVKQQISSSVKNAMLEKYGVENYLQTDEGKQKVKNTFMKKYGVTCSFELPQFLNGSKNSAINKAFAKRLDDYRIEYKQELHIQPYFYDFCLPKYKTLIEINPTYTHNTVGNHWGSGIDKNYHLEKTLRGNEDGYRVIHIFDWDNKDKILNSLMCEHTIYARNCNVEIETKTNTDVFLNNYHLQGTVRGQKVTLGLYFRHELVEIMTFGRPRYNKNYEWELLRLCTLRNYKVIGGASKLFSFFRNNYSPNSVISYCDISKFDGSVYEKIGMKLDHTTMPAKVWSKDSKKVTDNLLRSRGYDQLFHTDYGKGTSNEELMLDHGWLPVYDCGQKVFIWEL